MNLKPQPEVVELINQAIVEEPTTTLGEGGVIKAGFSEELDNLRSVSKNAKQYLANLERTEQEKTGIKNLKIGYNRVFGYYIEISKSNVAQAPENYIQKADFIHRRALFYAGIERLRIHDFECPRTDRRTGDGIIPAGL